MSHRTGNSSANNRRILRFKKALKHRSGLTLVELSIVILILAILLTSLFGVYYGATRMINKSAPVSVARQQSLLALEMVRTSINNTFYEPELERLVFFGKSSGSQDSRQDHLTFSSAVAGAEQTGSPEIREVSFYLKEDNERPGSYTLMRREDEHVDRYPGKGGTHYPVLEGVRSLKFRYSLNAKDWSDSWNTKRTRRIPRLVQIEIQVITDQAADGSGLKVEKFESLAAPGLYFY